MISSDLGRGRLRYFLHATALVVCSLLPLLILDSFVSRYLYPNLPFSSPSELVSLGPSSPPLPFRSMSPLMFRHLGELHSVPEVGAISVLKNALLTLDDRPAEMLVVRPADVGFLSVLKPVFIQGRNFTYDEDSGSKVPVAIIMQRVAARCFGTASAIGKTIILDGQSYQVVGVLSDSFRFQGEVDVLIPLGLPPDARESSNSLVVVGRIARGVSLSTVAAELRTVVSRNHGEMNVVGPGLKFDSLVSHLDDAMVRIPSQTLVLVVAFPAALSIFASISFVNLTFGYLVGQSRAIGIRLALGGGLRQATRPIIYTAASASLLGTIVSLLTAPSVARALRANLPESWLLSPINAPFTGGTLTITFLTGPALILIAAVVSLLYARLVVSSNLTRCLQRAAPPSNLFLIHISLFLQVVFSVLFLSVLASGLQGVIDLSRADLGLQSAKVMSATVYVPSDKVPTGEKLRGLLDQSIQQLGQLPGNAIAASAFVMPVGNPFSVPITSGVVHFDDVEVRIVSRDYFRCLDIPIDHGRSFTVEDGFGSEPVTLVNDAFVHHLILPGPLIGSYLSLDYNRHPFKVVGVVRDVHNKGRMLPASPAIYLLQNQVDDLLIDQLRRFMPVRYFVRAQQPVDSDTVARTLGRVSPFVAVGKIERLALNTDGDLRATRELLAVAFVIATLSLIISGISLYALASLISTLRRRDLAVMMCHGAQRRHLVYRLGKLCFGPVIFGLFCGLALSIISTGAALHNWDYLRVPHLSILLGFFTALIACYFFAALPPIARALCVNPAEVFTAE